MVPTQGGVSFPLECGLFYCLLLLPGIMSDQNTTMISTSTFVRSLINSYNLHCIYICTLFMHTTLYVRTYVRVLTYVHISCYSFHFQCECDGSR